MKRREFLKFSASLSASLMAAPMLGCDPLSKTASSSAKKPNIVLIVSDDQGFGDIGYYGTDIPTPNIDSIAHRGAAMSNFYVTAPVCTPSRYSILTGRHPGKSELGLNRVIMTLDERDRYRGLTENEATIAQKLKTAGYSTALIGKWHLGHSKPEHHPLGKGFDHFYGFMGGCLDYYSHSYGFLPDWYRNHQPVKETGYATDLMTDEAISFINDQSNDKPFFLNMMYNAPHYGKSIQLPEGEEDPNSYVLNKMPGKHKNPADGKEYTLTNTLQAKPEDLKAFSHIKDEKRRYYAAMVKGLDDGVGRILKTLNEKGMADNTIVMFVADNGPDKAGSSGSYRGAKHTLWEGGIRVPCFISWPGKIAPKTEIDTPCWSPDLLPTFCSIAGVGYSDLTIDGEDVTDVLEQDTADERVFWWENRKSKAVRQGKWKYIDGKLYDLDADPAEKQNLADKYPEKLAELESLWHEKMGK